MSEYRSQFGGLWTDQSDALEVVEAKLSRGTIDEADAERLRSWIENGLLVLPQAVPDAVVEEINADVRGVWEGAFPKIHVEYWEEHTMHIAPVRREMQEWTTKLLNLHGFSEPARKSEFAPAVLRFLRLLFEREPMAFQSLYFERGSEQPMHQDSAFVGVSSPMEFVGAWLALEDIQKNSGELEYYVGSHKIDEFLWDGEHKLMPNGHPDHDRYLASLHEQAAERGLRRESFRPKRGDVVLWHADLAHGGSAKPDPALTRRSLVTHYCPVELDPIYFTYSGHSPKIEHPSGAFHCHQYFWAEDPPEVEAEVSVGSRLSSFVTRLLGRSA